MCGYFGKDHVLSIVIDVPLLTRLLGKIASVQPEKSCIFWILCPHCRDLWHHLRLADSRMRKGGSKPALDTPPIKETGRLIVSCRHVLIVFRLKRLNQRFCSCYAVLNKLQCSSAVEFQHRHHVSSHFLRRSTEHAREPE